MAHPTPPSRVVAALLAAALVPLRAGGGAPSPGGDADGGIVMDGLFDDWDHVPVLVRDPLDAPPGSPVELTTVRAADDPAWLHLQVDVGRRVNAQGMPGTLHLAVDADGDEATGRPAFGMEGVDFVVELSAFTDASAPAAGPATHGSGFALRLLDAVRDDERRSAYDLGVAALPTWASDRFEIRVSRHGTLDGRARMASTIRLALAATSPSGPGDATDPAVYRFDSAPGPDPVAPALSRVRRKVEGAVRVAQWNVSEGSFRTPDGHAHLLGAVRPDVLLLDEVHGDASEEDLAAFFAHPALASLGSWSWVAGAGGGRQRTVVAARDRPVRQEPSMRRVEYDLAELEALRARVPPHFHAALDLEARIHMSATGAWVAVAGTEVLFVPLDLQSGGYLGSPQDLLREVQARTLHRHVRAVLDAAGGRVPVVVGGDYNVVGSDAPLGIVAEGLDVDGSDLAVAGPQRLGEASVFTWYDPRGGPFAPGRLDLTLYADAAFEEVGGFVFDTADLTDAQCVELGLDRGMSARASDHLIVVTDLRLR